MDLTLSPGMMGEAQGVVKLCHDIIVARSVFEIPGSLNSQTVLWQILEKLNPQKSSSMEQAADWDVGLVFR